MAIFKMVRDEAHGVTSFNGEYSDADLANLDLDPLGCMMLEQAAESPADQLLALETIFRATERVEARSRMPKEDTQWPRAILNALPTAEPFVPGKIPYPANGEEQPLVACPFCHKTEFLKLAKTGSYLGQMPAQPYRVVCSNLECEEVSGPVGYGKGDAAERWNRRTYGWTETGARLTINPDGSTKSELYEQEGGSTG